MIALAPIQLSPRLPNVPNPLAVPALDDFTSSTGSLVGVLLLLLLVLAAVVVRFRRSRDVERSQMRWFASVAAASITVIVAGFFLNHVNGTLGTKHQRRRVRLRVLSAHSGNDRLNGHEIRAL